MRKPVDAPIPSRGPGAWLAPRSDGARLHAGVDLRAPRAGAPVVAPEDGVVLAVAEASYGDDTPRWSRPPGWSGYGPVVILLRGASGYHHVIAHVGSAHVERGMSVDEGAPIGATSTRGHVHWEVRERPHPAPDQATVEISVDPSSWLEGRPRRWSGQCPPRPAYDRRTPRACRPGSRPTSAAGPTTARSRDETEAQHGRS